MHIRHQALHFSHLTKTLQMVRIMKLNSDLNIYVGLPCNSTLILFDCEQSICLYLSINLSVNLSIYLSIYHIMFKYLFLFNHICLSIYPNMFLFSIYCCLINSNLSIYLSIYLSQCLSYLSLYLYLYFSFLYDHINSCMS